MTRRWLIAAMLTFPPLPLLAQDAGLQQETGGDSATHQPTVAEIIAKGRDLYRTTEIRKGCKPAEGNEIVVCRRSQEEYRTDSSLDDAIREGRTYDEIPRAPDLVPPCPGCMPIGAPPVPPLIIELSAIPEALSPEEAEKVRAVPTEKPDP